MTRHPELLDRGSAILLLVDVQEKINAVMSDQSHVVRLEVLLDACAELDVPVVATEQYPKGLGATLESLAGRIDTRPLEKATFSCGGAPEVVAALDAAGRTQVVVTGIEAHVCVAQTALDLIEAGYRVQVPHDAVNSRRVADRDWALRRMAEAGAVVTSVESVLFEMLGRCATDDFRAVTKLIKRLPV